MTPGDLEIVAVEFYRRHKLDPDVPVTSAKLVRVALGPNALIKADLLRFPGPAATFVLRGERKIAIRPRLPIEAIQFFVAHELAHVVLEGEGVHEKGAHVERACDYLGACLMAPRPAAQRLHRVFGFEPATVARAVVADRTWASMRLAEATETPAAIVSPALVRVRGPEEFVWPDDRTIRAWAKRARAGLRRIVLGPGRTALVGEL